MTPDEFTALRRALIERTVSTARALFLGLDQYRERDVLAFVAQFLPLLRAGQLTMGQLVSLYLADLATASAGAQAQGLVVAPPPIPEVDLVDIRLGVRVEDVYRRPFVTIYAEIAHGAAVARPVPTNGGLAPAPGSMTAGVEKAVVRLAETVEMDLQQTTSSAMRAGMAALDERVRPRYWRRVLVGDESCALCVLASTQRYSRDDLAPVHPGCDCRVQPIYPGEGDPFAHLDDALVARAHEAAQQLTGTEDAGGRAVDYRAVRTNITAEHGEQPAPLLVRPHDRFTDAGDIPGDAPDRQTATDRR